MKLPIEEKQEDKRKRNPGRPKSVTERQHRQIIRQVPLLRAERKGCFFLGDIREAAAVPSSISDTTLRRVLHREGYRYRESAHKGVLSKQDLKIRYKFAKNLKKSFGSDIWWNGICFYLDGTGFTYKRNPCEYAQRSNRYSWRKKNERLAHNCTARGKKEGTGGRVARFMVAIAYNKGIAMCVHYTENLTGASFAELIATYFPTCFQDSNTGQKTKLFLQDGDPSQNSCVAKKELDKIGAVKFAIPARSPDLNPIENIFHIAKSHLGQDAIKRRITQESHPQFLERIKATLYAIPVELINKTISSMPKRVEMVIQRKGERIKY